jgi:hypothetical protein
MGGTFVAAALLTGLVVIAWAVWIVTTPEDPQIGVEYVFKTLYAIVALVLIWAVAAVVAVRRRRRQS